MRVIGWILAVLIAGSTSVSAEILRFRPTDGEKNLKEVTQYRRVRSMDGVVSTSNGGSETRIRFKKTASGYVAELNLIKTWSETDGHSTAGKLGQVLVGMPVKMALDNDGRIRQIDGLGAVSKKALLMVPSASRSQFQAVFSPDVIANKMTMEWEVRMGLIRNRTLTPGMLWIATQNVNLPSGEVMTSYLVTVVLQPGNDKLIPVRTYFDTNPNRLVTRIKAVAPQFRATAFFPKIGPTETENDVSGETNYKIDPSAGMIVDEAEKKKVVLTTLSDGTVLTSILLEERQTRLVP